MTNILSLLENGLFVTNFQTKADIFNEFLFNNIPLIKTIVPFRVLLPDGTQFWKTLRSIQVKF